MAFIATPLSPGSLFSEPMGLTMHGASYAALVLPVPIHSTIDHFEATGQALNHVANYNGFPVETLDIPRGPRFWEQEFLTQDDGPRARHARSRLKEWQAFRKCQQLREIFTHNADHEYDFYKTLEGQLTKNERQKASYAQNWDSRAKRHLREKRGVFAVAAGIMGIISAIVSLKAAYDASQVAANHNRLTRGLHAIAQATTWLGDNQERLANISERLATAQTTAWKVETHLNKIDYAIEILDTHCSQATTWINAAQHGQFHLGALTNANLPALAADLVDHLEQQDGNFLLARVPVDFTAGIGTFVETDDGVDIVLNVPIAKEENILHLYRRTSTAIHTADGTQVEIDTGPYEFLAINHEAEVWRAITSADLLQCKSVSGVRICDDMAVLRKFPSPQGLQVLETDDELCLFAAFFHQTELIRRACRLVQHKGASQMTQVDHTTVYITAPPSPQPAEVTCNNRPDTTFSQHPTMRVDVNPDCALLANDFFFNPSNNPFAIELIPQAGAGWSPAMADLIYRQPKEESLGDITETVREIRQDVSNQKATIQKIFREDIDLIQEHGHSAINSIITFIAICAIIAVAWRFSKLRSTFLKLRNNLRDAIQDKVNAYFAATSHHPSAPPLALHYVPTQQQPGKDIFTKTSRFM